MSDDHADNGTFEAINDSLYRKGATDGLPVVPPTDDRVEEMLTGTNLPPTTSSATSGTRRTR